MIGKDPLSADEIADLLRKTEINTDKEYDERKRAQLAAAFAARIFGGDNAKATERACFINKATRPIEM